MSLAALHLVSAGGAPVTPVPAETLTRYIPVRPSQALTGSQFAESISAMDRPQRELAIRDEILKGNVPDFLRKLAPVDLHWQAPDGKILTATIFVAPDYLAIGSDQDFLRIPMNLYTAACVAGQLGFVLPTKKMVDAIYRQSQFHFAPQPLAPGPQMTSTDYYRRHNRMIEEQARAARIPLGALVSGDKKDVVLTNRLASNPGRIAIYGWHRAEGSPIQPLSTVHGAGYADYSHGIRLISRMVLVAGKLQPIRELLKDPVLCRILSDEGPIHDIGALAPSSMQFPANLAAIFPSN